MPIIGCIPFETISSENSRTPNIFEVSVIAMAGCKLFRQNLDKQSKESIPSANEKFE